VEHRQTAEFGPEMLGVAADVQKALGRGMKEERIEHTRILKDEGAELVQQGGNQQMRTRMTYKSLSSVLLTNHTLLTF
jgi:hypothetical protein